MTGEVVFDASVILALFLQEQRAQVLTRDILVRSVASTVNLAEAQSKLVREGYEPQLAWEDSLSLVARVEPYSLHHARVSGDLIAVTRPWGLSLGDRSCLALALALQAPIYTTEHIWQNLNIGIPIHVLR